jgi:formylglycine-generating enzyme required for sulfatase activity
MLLKKIAILALLLMNGVFGITQNSGFVKGSMVYIPEGNYLPLYSGNSQPEQVAGFYIDRLPVTNHDFQAFVRDNPQWGKTGIKKLFADEGYLKYWNNNLEIDAVLKQSPVVNVSWFAAQKYCECLGKRLPTTAEWERVAAAGRTMENGRNEPGFQQWILDMASKLQQKPLPAVGQTMKNYYGVWDMHGLIWEWTYDFNTALTTGESRGNSSLDNTLFCGGGSFQSGDVENYAAFLRYAMRSSLKAKHVLQNLGFRCAGDKGPGDQGMGRPRD